MNRIVRTAGTEMMLMTDLTVRIVTEGTVKIVDSST